MNAGSAALAANNSIKNETIESARLPVMPEFDGYCLVSATNKKLKLGAEQHQLVVGGKTYFFSSADALRQFRDAPQLYLPAFSGKCLVSFLDSDSRVPGRIEHGMLFGKRLIVFASAEHRDRFRSNHKEYLATYRTLRDRARAKTTGVGRRESR